MNHAVENPVLVFVVFSRGIVDGLGAFVFVFEQLAGTGTPLFVIGLVLVVVRELVQKIQMCFVPAQFELDHSNGGDGFVPRVEIHGLVQIHK